VRIRFFLLIILCSSCAQSQLNKKPKYIKFVENNDSIAVVVKTPVLGNSFLKIRNVEKQTERYIDFQKQDSIRVLQFLTTEIDTLAILKKYKFNLYYGESNLKSYDTLYNYGLPFLKGKRYKILQGQNTNFTHKGSFSRYAIDFKMNVGQTICAIRDGLVVNVKEDSNKGGRNKKYLKDGNYLVIAHKDGTFSQYVHLKKEGAIVAIGDTVKKGQPIAYSGNTGMSTEPHLHFAVYKPTTNGFVSIPFILNTHPSSKYKKGRYAKNKITNEAIAE